MRKFLLFTLLAMVFITACAKLPDQVRQAKAFSDKGYIVQDNLKYEIKEYNFGRVLGTEVVETGTYYNVRAEISNVGQKKDKIPFDKIELEAANVKLKPDANLIKKANQKEFLDKEIAPGEKVEGWFVFPTTKMPTSVKLHIKESVIEIQ